MDNDINEVSCRVVDVSKFFDVVQHISAKDDIVIPVKNARRQALVTEYIKLLMQIATLKNVAAEYPGKTIENIIVQMEARKKELINNEEINRGGYAACS